MIQCEIPKNEAHVWIVKLCADQRSVRRASSLLSEDERQRATRFNFDSLRTRFILSHGVLRILLARYCDCAPTDLLFASGVHGKPFLADVHNEVGFNMSHSGNIAAYAFIRRQKIGIDVEEHRSFSDLENIASRVLSPAEFRYVINQAEGERYSAFFRCWVCKEAYIKAHGGGLSIPLDSFRVSFAPGGPEASVWLTTGNVVRSRWKIEEFYPLPGYSGAVAFEDSCSHMHVHEIQSADKLFLEH